MSLKNRIRRIEQVNSRNFDDWISNLSDDELLRIINKHGSSNQFAEWLKTLTDEEVETVRFNRPGAAKLRRKYDEFEKQN